MQEAEQTTWMERNLCPLYCTASRISIKEQIMEKELKLPTKVVAVRLSASTHKALMKMILVNETKSNLLRRVIDTFLRKI